MKVSINVKIPLSIAQRMDENGHISSDFIGEFIEAHIDKDEIPAEPLNGLTFSYTCKIPVDTHMKVKLQSVYTGLTMGEIVGRLIVKYYN